MRASWGVLRQDRELLVFPILSGLATLAVLATFAVPLLLAGGVGRSHGAGFGPLEGALVFLFYFCSYFVVIFFNVALVACAVARMQGRDPGVQYGLSAALSRLPQIAGWALVAATVGLVLKLIESRGERAGRFVARVVGTAWTLVTFLVVPVMVVEGKGPFESLRTSAGLLKRTWGEQLISQVSFGFVFFVLAIPGIATVFFGLFAGVGGVLVLCLSLGVLYLLGLSLIQASLQGIFQAALYLYANDGVVPPGFDAGDLSGAVG